MHRIDQTKRILYVGENLHGTTSRYRRTLLDELYGTKSVVLDFNTFLPKLRLFKSIFWRLQHLLRLRPFERALNKELGGVKYDLVWIDKGLFMKSNMIVALRNHSEKLVFYTPDCFFHKNRVPAIRKQLHEFDIVVTTKSFEVTEFEKYISPSRLVLTSQGYSKVDQIIFREDRDHDVLFIGKYEAHREMVIKHLAKGGFRIAVGGAGWRNRSQTMNTHRVTFLGDDFRGSEYHELLSKSKICLGLLSKEFPELHTTRTFEIPYLGSVLATERNIETLNFFDESQVLFYSTLDELMMKMHRVLENGCWRDMAKAGQKRVLNSPYSWEDHIVEVIERLGAY